MYVCRPVRFVITIRETVNSNFSTEIQENRVVRRVKERIFKRVLLINKFFERVSSD